MELYYVVKPVCFSLNGDTSLLQVGGFFTASYFHAGLIFDTSVVWYLDKSRHSNPAKMEPPKVFISLLIYVYLLYWPNTQVSFRAVTFLKPRHFRVSPMLLLPNLLLSFVPISLACSLLCFHLPLFHISEIDSNCRHHWIKTFQQTLFLTWGLLTIQGRSLRIHRAPP